MQGDSLQAVQGLAVVIVPVLTGFLGRRMNLISHERADLILNLILYILLPLSALRVYATVDVPPMGHYVVLAGIACNVLGLALALCLAKKVTPDRRRQGVFALAVSTMNTGLLGLAIVRSLFDELGVLTLLLVDLPNALYTIVFAQMVAYSYGGGGEKGSLPRRLATFLASPYVLGIIVGVLMNAGLVVMPTEAMTLISWVSALTPPATLLAMGAYVSLTVAHVRETLCTLGLRILSGLSVFLAIKFATPALSLFPEAPLLVSTTLPPAILVLAHSRRFDLDVGFAAEVLSAGLVYSVLGTIALVFAWQ